MEPHLYRRARGSRAPRRSGALGALIAIPLLLGCEATPGPTAAPSIATAVPAPSVSSGPSSAPSQPTAAFRWAGPQDGATHHARRVTLSVTADGQAGVDGTVVFSIGWPGNRSHEVCSASTPDETGAWRCSVDLARVKAPAGPLELDFDVDRGAAVEKSPDGTRTLDYRPPPPRWRTARAVMPKRCFGPALAIDSSSTYHVAASCGRGSLGYAEGSATGDWTMATLSPPKQHTDEGPQLAIDDDTLYLAYTRFGPLVDAETCGPGVEFADIGVYVRTRHLPEGAWSKPRRIGEPWDLLEGLRVQDGRIYVTVESQKSFRTFLETIDGSTIERVRLRQAYAPSLRVGTDGVARLAYLDTDGDVRLASVRGTEMTSRVIADEGTLVNPLLVLGPGNQPHVVWTRDITAEVGCGESQLDAKDGTYYATLVDGRWRVERVTKATGDTSLVLDTDSGAVHVLVNGSTTKRGGNKLTHYERVPGRGWTSTTLRKAVDPGAVIRRDDANGTLVVAFRDDGGVRVMTRR